MDNLSYQIAKQGPFLGQPERLHSHVMQCTSLLHEKLSYLVRLLLMLLNVSQSPDGWKEPYKPKVASFQSTLSPHATLDQLMLAGEEGLCLMHQDGM